MSIRFEGSVKQNVDVSGVASFHEQTRMSKQIARFAFDQVKRTVCG
jgi:hypothetical protein